MKKLLVVLTFVTALASAPLANAQQPDDVIARTHWSYGVLKKLTYSLDVNPRLSDTQIKYTDFYRDDFRFTRRQAALATLQILDRMARFEEKNIVLSYTSQNDIINGFDIRNKETKEAVLALAVEYQQEMKLFDANINEKWLRKNVSGYLETQTSEQIIPHYHWAYEALAKICEYLDFDSESWLPLELYGGKQVRPVVLTRREVAVMLLRIFSESKAASGFNERTFRVQKPNEAEVIDLIDALRTELADDLATLGYRSPQLIPEIRFSG